MRILITAGPTHEHLDPVRYLTNGSTGLQGIFLAKSAARFERGAQVVLIIGPTNIELPKYKNIQIIRVTSADEMYEAVNENFKSCDVAIFSAAVADYKPKFYSDQKIKKNSDNLPLELIPNKDIALEMGKIKREDQISIGFALETNDGTDHAKEKLERKNFDYIILNEITEDNPIFGSMYNKVTIIGKDGSEKKLARHSKDYIAHSIIDLI